MSVQRGRRGARAIELGIQLFVMSIIAYSVYITTVEIGWKWLIIYRGQTISGGLYLAAVLLLISVLGFIYASLISGRSTHNIPQYPVPDKDDLTEPYECIDLDGRLATCGKCNGAWKPPRSHHCSTCGVCRMDLDHHCPWVGNCVTRARMKRFLTMLLLAPVTYSVSMIPVYRPLMQHMSLALNVSRHDPWANQVWWDWYGSWIFFGGPFGRWIFGMALGFRILKTKRRVDLPLLEQPSLRLFSICSLGLLFSLFTLTLAVWTIKDQLRGLTTLDAMQESRQKQAPRFVCIPRSASCIPRDDGAEDNTDDEIAGCSKVVEVLPTERLYDLGPWANLRDIFERPWRDSNHTIRYRWPRLNASVLERIRKMTSHPRE
ncbi:DHHC palmitoyltransferase-domain-containing protein [Mycena galopus ATCC 62051]|nr:DHHC palmitoyltransferase-domain-containing protein [Mycena galopus ATCC 62051]